MFATVLAASAIGSLHCVGMCGGFVAAVGGARREWGPSLAYQLARGFAYVGVGALAGLLGAGLDGSAALVGVQRLAGPLMGLTLIAMAIASLWPSAGPSEPLISLGARAKPTVLGRVRLALTSKLREGNRMLAGAAAGLLSALLPCGWLWAYVVVAASTGSAGQGSLVMAAFWLGSVPALLGVGLLAGELGRRLGRHAPRLSAAVMLLLGVLSLFGKLEAPHVTTPAPEPATEQVEASEPAQVPTQAPCH
jgi:hypothetical protein